MINDTDLRDILTHPKPTRSGQYRATCPFCGKEEHFYISRKTGLWDCKKCGEMGNLYKLLRFLDKTYLLQGQTVEQREVIESLRKMTEEAVSGLVEPVSELPKVSMPAGWKVADKGVKYLKERGVSATECRRYSLGTTDLYEKYRNYILIPIYDGGEIRGFLGRYAGKKVPEGKLRYNNSRGTEFSELLFGYDEIDARTIETVILVEGIFDKIAVDRVLRLWENEEVKCVCTFGKKVSEKQIAKLVRKNVGNVILLYDFDAIKEIRRYGLELQKFFNTSITFTTRKDIDECTPEEALEVFEHLQSPDEFNTGVIGKLKR